MKIFFMSIGVLICIMGSWFAANFFYFGQERTKYQRLVSQIKEESCVNQELSRLPKGAYYDSILKEEQGLLEKKIPSAPDLASILDMMSHAAKDAGALLGNFEPGEPKEQLHWFELPIHVSFTATFPQLIAILQAFSRAERIIVLKDLEFNGKEAYMQFFIYFGEGYFRTMPRDAMGTYYCGEYTHILNNAQTLLLSQPSPVSDENWSRDPFMKPSAQVILESVELVGLLRLEKGQLPWMALFQNDSGEGKVVRVGEELIDGFKVEKIMDGIVQVASKYSKTKYAISWGN